MWVVVFIICMYFYFVMDIVVEDYVFGCLVSVIRSWDDKVSVYKGREKYESVLFEYFDVEYQKQLDRGLEVDKEDEVRKYLWQ